MIRHKYKRRLLIVGWAALIPRSALEIFLYYGIGALIHDVIKMLYQVVS